MAVHNVMPNAPVLRIRDRDWVTGKTGQTCEALRAISTAGKIKVRFVKTRMFHDYSPSTTLNLQAENLHFYN
jgi:hypothetical protein